MSHSDPQFNSKFSPDSMRKEVNEASVDLNSVNASNDPLSSFTVINERDIKAAKSDEGFAYVSVSNDRNDQTQCKTR
jgi:hypothetical protein